MDTKYYVDIPTVDCIDKPDGAFKNVAEFDTPEEAIAFCKEHFGTDDKGCICLISPIPSGE